MVRSIACLLVGGAMAVMLVAVAQAQKIRQLERHQKQESDQITPSQWNQAQHVFVAQLTQVDQGPVGRSLPPLYSHTLHFEIRQVFRGSLTADSRVTAHHSARQHDRPTFPIDKECLVTAKASADRLQVLSISEVSMKQLQEISLACSLPIGWTVEKGKAVSPWASLGQAAWNGGVQLQGKHTCSKTGRPALLVGERIEFKVDKVPPSTEIKWTNPDGDGEYRITLTNTTDTIQQIPALLTDGERVLWRECLLMVCQDKVYPCPGCKGISGEVRCVELKPGESISTVVHALRLDGPEWPRGGYRIEFQFCLGEKSETESFYYLSRHHDAIRQKVQADGRE